MGSGSQKKRKGKAKKTNPVAEIVAAGKSEEISTIVERTFKTLNRKPFNVIVSRLVECESIKEEVLFKICQDF